MNFTDPWGLKPGDIFQTVEEAAIDFGNTYNDDSIRKNREYGSSVYYDPLGNGYTYTTPARGSSDSVIASVDQLNQIEAQLHTHAAYANGYRNNDFSDADIKLSEKANVPSYVATPNGSLMVYDPNTNQTNSVKTDLPSDKNDPSRLNSNDPSAGVDDSLRTQSQTESVLDIIVNAIFGQKDEESSGGCRND